MSPGCFRLADCVIRPSEHIIERDGEAIHVEPRTMWLLMLLAEHPGEVVGREAIEARLWDGRVVGYDALTQVVAKLRKALGDDAHAPRYLLTIPKGGYQLIADVQSMDATTVADIAHTAGPRTDASATNEIPESPATSRATVRPRWRSAAILLLVLGTAMAAGWWYSSQNSPIAPAESSANRPSIAVLPFENKNADAADHYLADGLTEDLTAALTHFPELLVIARHSALALNDGKPTEVSEVRKRLGIRYVLLGSIQSDHGAIRVQAHLVDAEHNVQMWSQKWDTQRGDLFRIQDQVVDAIASRTLPHVQEAEKSRARRKPTENLDAYDLFQRARSEKHKLTAEGEARAAELLRQAIALDPNFAEAHALLGWANGLYRIFTGSGPPFAESLTSVQRGLELNPNQSLGYQALAQVLTFMGKHEEAARAGKRGIELNPNDAENHIMFSRAASTAGLYEEALTSAERAVQLNPLYPKWYPFIYSRALYVNAQYQRAADVCVEGMARQIYIGTAISCAAALAHLGRQAEAAAMVSEARKAIPHLTLQHALASWGFREEGMQSRFATDLAAAGLSG